MFSKLQNEMHRRIFLVFEDVLLEIPLKLDLTRFLFIVCTKIIYRWPLFQKLFFFFIALLWTFSIPFTLEILSRPTRDSSILSFRSFWWCTISFPHVTLLDHCLPSAHAEESPVEFGRALFRKINNVKNMFQMHSPVHLRKNQRILHRSDNGGWMVHGGCEFD